MEDVLAGRLKTDPERLMFEGRLTVATVVQVTSFSYAGNETMQPFLFNVLPDALSGINSEFRAGKWAGLASVRLGLRA